MKLSTSFLMIQDDKNKIEEIDKYTDYMHYDIMDGIFTENKTIDYDILMENTKNIKSPKDVHLMVKDIKKYAHMFAKINPEFITFHLETMETGDIDYIKSKNIKVGIAINPSTDVKELLPYLDKIDLVLVMSVKAGKGGQKFIDISDKIDYLDNYRKENNLHYLIEVDGGINPEVLNKVSKADMIVVGSFITNGNIKEKIEEIKSTPKKSGFTLAELMGVIVILGVLAIIVTTAVDKNITNSRYETCKTQEKTIIEAAKMLVTDNPSKLPDSNSFVSITVEELTKDGYLDDKLENPMSGSVYEKKDSVKITAGSNKDYTYTVEYNTADYACPE